MIRRLVGASLQLRFLVVVAAIVLIVFGIQQLREMPVDIYPEFNPPLVEIQTEALGLSAAEMEALITVPMEADLLNGVAWLDQIYSETVAGLSSIILVFEPGTDPIRARQMVQERLNQTYALPNVSQPPTMLQPLSSAGRVMMVGLSSDELSLIEMGVLARWNIVPRLLGVPGVSNVATWGQRERQLQVQIDPVELRSKGVTIQQVIETTGEALWVSPLSFLEASTPGTAGWIDTPNQRLTIRHLLPISSAEDLSKVVVEGGNGLFLGDVANVVEDHQPLIGDAFLNDGPGLLLVIEKFPGANTLEVTRAVEEAMETMRPGLTGIEFDTTIFRPANYIEHATANLSIALVAGAGLAFLVFSVFFFGWRTTLISLLVIPLSLIATTYILYLRGATMNVMLLAGLMIALAMVIDDAVISVENIARRLRQRRSEGSGFSNGPDETTGKIISESLVELYGPIGFALLIIVFSALPFFVMEGTSAAFFQPFVSAYLLAVFVSLLVTLTVTPALSFLLVSRGSLDRRESPFMGSLARGYHTILTSTINRPRLVYAIIAAVVLAGLVALPFLKVALLPSLKKTELLIQWEGTPGMSRVAMNRVLAQASSELQTIPGVLNVGSHVGRAITGDAVVGINSGELWININPAADYDATVATVREVVQGYPGLFNEVKTYQPERIGEALMGANQDMTVRVYGHDLEAMNNKAQEVSQLIAGVAGVVDVRANTVAEEPQIEVEVDLAAAERYQVKPGDVRRNVAVLVSGLLVGNLYEEQKVFDVVVWGVPELRRSLSDLRDLRIDTPRGQVRLEDLADIRIAPSPIIIRRDAVSRFIDVSVTTRGRNVNAVAADIDRLLQGVEFPFEHHAEVLGDSAARLAAQQRITVFGFAGLIGILLLLQAAFRSWRMAFAVLLSLPIALAGGVLAAFLSGGISLGSVFGFFTILGITLRSGILLISYYRKLEKQEGNAIGPELVMRGARERLKPTLMSALATAVVLLPIVIIGDKTGLEFVRPLAIVILGGLVPATLLSLFVYPSLYVRLSVYQEPEIAFEPVDFAPAPTGD
jgi:CzcA family heavy metal efflux pump